MSGEIFSRLTVIQQVPDKSGYWRFYCACGNITIKRKSEVTTGRAQSCGCLRKELFKKNFGGQRRLK